MLTRQRRAECPHSRKRQAVRKGEAQSYGPKAERLWPPGCRRRLGHSVQRRVCERRKSADTARPPSYGRRALAAFDFAAAVSILPAGSSTGHFRQGTAVPGNAPSDLPRSLAGACTVEQGGGDSAPLQYTQKRDVGLRSGDPPFPPYLQSSSHSFALEEWAG
jgi:hypothetical protein